MENYDNHQVNNRTPLLSPNETILWQGKPKMVPFYFNWVVAPIPFLAAWGAFAYFLLGANVDFSAIGSHRDDFPALLMMAVPVVVFLYLITSVSFQWKNNKYYLTNRRLIIQNGFLSYQEISILYKEIDNVYVRRNITDRIFGTGTVHIESNGSGRVMYAMENSQEIYNRIQRVILDIQTDMEFPNAFRPQNNTGYHTDYKE